MTSNATIQRRYAGVQTFFKDACLFLSLSSIAEQVADTKVDILGTYAYCKQQGYINSNDDMTVEGQCRYLRDLTGKLWTREVVQQLPSPLPKNVFVVEKWKNAATGKQHFRRDFVDSLRNSLTVKEGKLIEYYLYKMEDKTDE
jgi:hypothetical protein